MIFVTTGSVAPFDELIKEVDRLAEEGLFYGTEVIAQIGNGEYIPKRMTWFRFKRDLSEYYARADLIITHGGAGTIFEILRVGKKAIAVPNFKAIYNPDILIKMSKEGHILLCTDLRRLRDLIIFSKNWRPKPYREVTCRIHDIISRYLLS